MHLLRHRGTIDGVLWTASPSTSPAATRRSTARSPTGTRRLRARERRRPPPADPGGSRLRGHHAARALGGRRRARGCDRRAREACSSTSSRAAAGRRRRRRHESLTRAFDSQNSTVPLRHAVGAAGSAPSPRPNYTVQEAADRASVRDPGVLFRDEESRMWSPIFVYTSTKAIHRCVHCSSRPAAERVPSLTEFRTVFAADELLGFVLSGRMVLAARRPAVRRRVSAGETCTSERFPAHHALRGSGQVAAACSNSFASLLERARPALAPAQPLLFKLPFRYEHKIAVARGAHTALFKTTT